MGAPRNVTLDMTLEEAKEWLRERVEEGAHCPCCNQMAKRYRRKINSTMARTLLKLYRAGGAEKFIHTPSLPGDTHEASQLAWWGLAIEEKGSRIDGGRAGYWMLTERGVDFALDRIKLPKYAIIYDSRVRGLDGENVGIQDALGSRFNYRELMEGI